ncbi:nicotinamide N-methyltransferase-like [Ixodes scapularis]|uniref:nicotinamide N-methyltransferase-like n=1 Tax=Ixodes scapularis TaxID=6945 RepID=UPI001A9DA00B|nr:nicotinamide N-methyltransferase-like [Ixodes scapularis]
MNYGHLIEKYRRDFHSRAYPDRLKRVPYVNRFFQRELHDIYTSPSFRGKSLLDVGCGPTVHNVFPATTKIQNVVLSDLCAGNRREVENWIQKTPGAIDCSFISEALAAVEGHVDLQSGAKEIEERTRRAIKKTIPCNILDPNVLSKEHRETFDVVFSSLCLESASLDEQTYQKNTQNIGNLVAPGGYLILCGIAGSLEYSVGGIKFPSLCLTSTIVTNSLINAGFEVKRWSSLDKDATFDDPERWDYVFVVVAQKPISPFIIHFSPTKFGAWCNELLNP